MPNAPRITQRHAAKALGIAAAMMATAAGADEPNNSAAHALAAKFAAAAESKTQKELKTEEQEMLERAEAEALERKAIAEKEAAEKEKADREAEEAAKAKDAHRLATEAEAQKAKEKAEAERIAREDAERKAKDEQRLAEEKRKAEETARLAAEAEAQKAKEKAEAERIAREDAERKAKDEQRLAEEKRKAEETARLAAEAETQKAKEKAEAERIAREDAERKAKDEQRLAEEKRRAEEAARLSAQAKTAPNGPVTVLLIMEPGATGIRRYGAKTADPVICAETRCWISSGAGAQARMVSRGQALGPGNTLGNRAAACNHSLGCVFRGVDLSNVGLLQPIDLRVMRHDRREPQRITADATCEATPSLTCGNLIRSATWRAWIVPEDVAAKAGDKALLRALETGLAPGHQALLSK